MSEYYYIIVNYDDLLGMLKVMHDETEDIAHLHFSTLQKVNALKEEWFGDAATAFFNQMENHLLPQLRHVMQALIATQDRIKQVMGTYSEADRETMAYFLPEALAPGHFSTWLFNDPSGKPVNLPGAAGLMGAAGLAGGALGAGLSGGTTGTNTPVTDASLQTDAAAMAEQAAAEAAPPAATGGSTPGGGGGTANSDTPAKPPGFDQMGESLRRGPEHSAFVGGAGAGVEGLPDQGSAGSGGGGSGASSSAGSGGTGGPLTPGTDSGAAGAAGLGAGVAGAAALGGAAKVLKDQQKE